MKKMFILLTCFSGLLVCVSACKKKEQPVIKEKSEIQKKVEEFAFVDLTAPELVAQLTEKEKQYFVNSVDRVKLYYALKTDNSNIEADIIEDCTYDEIVFIELKLRNLDNFDKISKIIHSSIPKPLVIVSNYEEDIAISVATKTNNNNKKNI